MKKRKYGSKWVSKIFHVQEKKENLLKKYYGE